MCPSCSRRGSVEGFTLLELMVVLILIGILSAAVVPAMRGTLEGEVMHAQTRALVGAVDLAYSRAITVRQTHRVVIDLGERSYRVEGRAEQADGRAKFLTVPSVSGAAGPLDSRITVEVRRRETSEGAEGRRVAGPPREEAEPSGNVSWLNFYADGTADPVDIVLRDRQGVGQVLRVNPVTARLQIRELPRL